MVWCCHNNIHMYTEEKVKLEIPKIEAHFTGSGDLFTALLLAQINEGLQVSL